MLENKITKSGQNVQQQGAPGAGAMYYENLMGAITTGFNDLRKTIRNQPTPTVTVPPPKVEVHGLSKEDVETIVENAMSGQNEKLDKIDEIVATLNDINAAQNSVSYLERIAKFIFTKRALILFLVLVAVAVTFGSLYYDYRQKSDRLDRIEISDLKYRYVRAVGYSSPRMLFQLDSICSEGPSDMMDVIRNRVDKYEERVREKSDSIVHAEQQKKARL